MEEIPMTLAQWKKANPEILKYIAPKYKKYRKEFFKARRGEASPKMEGEDVGIKEDAAKLVSDVGNAINPPKAAPVVKIDFNVEVEAVVRACDDNRAKLDRVQDIITDRAVPEEALLSLEEIHIALGNVKALTVKMLASYKEADAGIAVLEKEATEIFNSKKKLAQIRATRTKEKTEAQ
jgi:hypothetical protein